MKGILCGVLAAVVISAPTFITLLVYLVHYKYV